MTLEILAVIGILGVAYIVLALVDDRRVCGDRHVTFPHTRYR